MSYEGKTPPTRDGAGYDLRAPPWFRSRYPPFKRRMLSLVS